MSCDKGYRDECCCECENHFEIKVCNCGGCPVVTGYVCIAFHKMDKSYTCVYSTREHGCCELFIARKI